MKQFVSIATIALFFSFACGTAKKAIEPVTKLTSLKLIDIYDVPHQFNFKGTTVGGLSGIDYDSTSTLFYTISDDRSALQPARYYTMKILFNEKGIDTLLFQNVVTLLQPSGASYPSVKDNPKLTPDPEAIRYNPITKEIVWTSEGERLISNSDTIIQSPSINIITKEGRFKRSFTLPDNLVMRATENGPRRNGVLEGASFANNYQTLYVNLEEPRYEDGPQAGLASNDAWIRLFAFNVKSGKRIAEYAYKLDPVAYAPNPAGSFMVNGVPDILSLGNNQLLVMERSFSTGRLACTVKIFLVDVKQATDISEINSLKKEPPTSPLQKKLLLNMDALGIYTDNIEGMCFGPRLPNGKRTLWMIADNNFSPLERTQVFLFEVNE